MEDYFRSKWIEFQLTLYDFLEYFKRFIILVGIKIQQSSN